MKVILFDGFCNLCNGVVNWLIDHDKKDQFKFATLQSNYGKQKVEEMSLRHNYMGTIILVDESKTYTHSDAVIQILKLTGGIYSLAMVISIIPKFIRNFLYKIVADNRYHWFGKCESCRVPTSELKEKFLE